MTATGEKHNDAAPVEDHADEGPPPLLKKWKNLYFLVIINLVFWIILFTLFTWIFE